MKFIKLLLLSSSFSLLYACSQSGKSGQVGSLVDSLVSAKEAAGLGTRFKPGYIYMVEGEIQGLGTIKGKFSVNSEMQVLFTYSNIRRPELKKSLYGYIKENDITMETEDGEIKGIIADEIKGTWRISHSDTPFILKITGCAASSISTGIVTPVPYPEKLVIVEDNVKDTNSVSSMSENVSDQVVEVKYVPVTVEGNNNTDVKAVSVEPEEDVNKAYDKVEMMPEYPGGVTAMIKFISQNLEYPKVCQENGTQGRVGVRFIVGRDGTISNVNVLKSVDPFLDKEAVRVIKAMPRWKPGMHKGKPVNVSYVVPVNFKLQ